MVNHQQQPLAAIGQRRQYRAQQRPVLQVQAALRCVGKVCQGLGIWHVRQPEQVFAVAGWRTVTCLPTLARVGKAQTQAIVMHHQRVQGVLQHPRIESLCRLEHHRLVPVLTLRDRLFEEQPLYRQQR